MFANVREKVAVSKRAAQKFRLERFNVRKLISWRLGNSIRLISQKNLNDGEDIKKGLGEHSREF